MASGRSETEAIVKKAKERNLLSYLLFLMPPSSIGSKSLIRDEQSRIESSSNTPGVFVSKAQLASAQAFRVEVQALLKELSGPEQFENSKLMLEQLFLVDEKRRNEETAGGHKVSIRRQKKPIDSNHKIFERQATAVFQAAAPPRGLLTAQQFAEAVNSFPGIKRMMGPYLQLGILRTSRLENAIKREGSVTRSRFKELLYKLMDSNMRMDLHQTEQAVQLGSDVTAALFCYKKVRAFFKFNEVEHHLWSHPRVTRQLLKILRSVKSGAGKKVAAGAGLLMSGPVQIDAAIVALKRSMDCPTDADAALASAEAPNLLGSLFKRRRAGSGGFFSNANNTVNNAFKCRSLSMDRGDGMPDSAMLTPRLQRDYVSTRGRSKLAEVLFGLGVKDRRRILDFAKFIFRRATTSPDTINGPVYVVRLGNTSREAAPGLRLGPSSISPYVESRSKVEEGMLVRIIREVQGTQQQRGFAFIPMPDAPAVFAQIQLVEEPSVIGFIPRRFLHKRKDNKKAPPVPAAWQALHKQLHLHKDQLMGLLVPVIEQSALFDAEHTRVYKDLGRLVLESECFSYECYTTMPVCSLSMWQADFLVRVTYVVRLYLSQVMAAKHLGRESTARRRLNSATSAASADSNDTNGKLSEYGDTGDIDDAASTVVLPAEVTAEDMDGTYMSTTKRHMLLCSVLSFTSFAIHTDNLRIEHAHQRFSTQDSPRGGTHHFVMHHVNDFITFHSAHGSFRFALLSEHEGGSEDLQDVPGSAKRYRRPVVRNFHIDALVFGNKAEEHIKVLLWSFDCATISPVQAPAFIAMKQNQLLTGSEMNGGVYHMRNLNLGVWVMSASAATLENTADDDLGTVDTLHRPYVQVLLLRHDSAHERFQTSPAYDDMSVVRAEWGLTDKRRCVMSVGSSTTLRVKLFSHDDEGAVFLLGTRDIDLRHQFKGVHVFLDRWFEIEKTSKAKLSCSLRVRLGLMMFNNKAVHDSINNNEFASIAGVTEASAYARRLEHAKRERTKRLELALQAEQMRQSQTELAQRQHRKNLMRSNEQKRNLLGQIQKMQERVATVQQMLVQELREQSATFKAPLPKTVEVEKMLEKFDFNAAQEKHVRSECEKFRKQIEANYALASHSEVPPWLQDLDLDLAFKPAPSPIKLGRKLSVDETHYSKRMHHANIPDEMQEHIKHQREPPPPGAKKRIKRREQALANVRNIANSRKHMTEDNFGQRIDNIFGKDLYLNIDEKTSADLNESLARDKSMETLRAKRERLAAQSREVDILNSHRGIQMMSKQLGNYIDEAKQALGIAGGPAPTGKAVAWHGDALRSHAQEAAALEQVIRDRYKAQQQRYNLAKERNKILKQLRTQIGQQPPSPSSLF